MAVVEWKIVMPASNKAPVWGHFEYVKDSATGKATVGKKATCRSGCVEWKSRTLAK